MRTVVIYHGGACRDGFTAAWVLRKAYPDAEFVPANYGDVPPDVTGATVVIADFSYPRRVMFDLIHQTRGNLTVLDHHKSAEAELRGIDAECYRDTLDRLPTVVFDMTKSGARLAWEHAWGVCYSPGGRRGLADFRAYDGPVIFDNPPWLVRYTEDRDLWRWALPHSPAINAALRTHPLEFAVWDDLAETHPHGHVIEGEAILRAEQAIVDQHVRHARETDIGGHKVLAVNATTLMSEIAGKLAEGRPFGACYFDDGAGLRRWSLRSTADGVDVSEVARKFPGGGGHRNAAGFEERLTLAPPRPGDAAQVLA